MEVLLFGIVREIVGAPTLALPEAADLGTVAALRAWLFQQYPRLADLRTLAVAVDNEYADDELRLEGAEEIALIPPVSGG